MKTSSKISVIVLLLYVLIIWIGAREGQIEHTTYQPKKAKAVKEVEPAYTVTEPDLEDEAYYDSLELLAHLVYAEAGNQDFKGKCLVVDVVLNRVASEKFPDTIYDVIMQPEQFTTIKNGAVEAAGYADLEECYEAVYTVVYIERLDTEILYFTSGGYGNYGTPAYQHGDHYFCK